MTSTGSDSAEIWSSAATPSAPTCHGYTNGCACVRCCDRASRTDALVQAGQPFHLAAALAKSDSAEHFCSL